MGSQLAGNVWLVGFLFFRLKAQKISVTVEVGLNNATFPVFGSLNQWPVRKKLLLMGFKCKEIKMKLDNSFLKNVEHLNVFKK